jgi:hypothetical protein
LQSSVLHLYSCQNPMFFLFLRFSIPVIQIVGSISDVRRRLTWLASSVPLQRWSCRSTARSTIAPCLEQVKSPVSVHDSLVRVDAPT